MYIYVCVWWGWCWAPECSGKALVRERHGPNPFEHNVEPGVGCPCVNVDLEPALANLKMSPTLASDATRTSESWACCSTLGGWLCESLKPLMKGRVRPQLATVQTLLGPLARFFPSQSPQTMCACTKGRLGRICLFGSPGRKADGGMKKQQGPPQKRATGIRESPGNGPSGKAPVSFQAYFFEPNEGAQKSSGKARVTFFRKRRKPRNNRTFAKQILFSSTILRRAEEAGVAGPQDNTRRCSKHGKVW